ncbi:anti-sigma factor [Polaribacter vadi]|uniref:anti-sigma factor n=1 Tax=Polaribacter TaxID=52959 RepID=UPI001C097AB1|nr:MULTISPECIES: anti-sigma factor [Polaribacter]MBU3012455.1 anti-sigma factor [Polaribacter vadi]MDO6742272.1 anti-sigma factor [Polaribacter sp. 1_MG-2023]
MKKILKLAYLCAAFVLFASCENNEEVSTTGELVIDLTGLEELGSDFVYEGWLIVDGNPVSTGTFTSVIFPQTYTVNNSDLNSASTFVLSIEPAIDSDPAPAATKLLAGDFSGNSANVTSTGIVADFSTSWGKYILATPTDDDASNEASGVWFLDNSSGTAVTGLGLPTLSDGWKYEGWVVLNGTPVSTGTFLDPANADDNASTSPYKGTLNDGPAYPGEDYVVGSAAGVDFPTDLKDATIVISVEPYPDNSAAPFTLKPLANIVPSDAMNHSVLTLDAGPILVLTGTVSR